MVRYLSARLAQAIGVVIAAYTTTFILLNVIPSDPIAARLADPSSALSPKDAERLYQYYGLDKSVISQFFDRVVALFHGDLGFSITNGDRVSDRIFSGLGMTLQLTALGLLFAVLLAVAIVTVATMTRSPRLRNLLDLSPSLFMSVPMFWLGLIIIQIFSFRLGWFVSIKDDTFGSLLFASLAIAIPVSAPIAQVLQASLRDVYHEPFIDLLHTKGLSRFRIYSGHALRNSLLPVLTIFGLTLGELIAGAVVTETIFARRGLGQITEKAVTTQDLPVIQGVVLVASIVFVLANFAVDIVYPVIDPRVRTRVAAKVPVPVLTPEPASVEAELVAVGGRP